MFRVALFLLVASTSALSASCLNEVSAFATEICGQIQESGSTQLIEANGELKAEFSGIIRKVLSDSGINAKGKILQDTYEGVLREDLAKERFNARYCKMKMAEKAIAQVCKPEGDPPRTAFPDDGKGSFCCDSTGNHRCSVITRTPLQVGTPCLCDGLGKGYVCQ